MTATQIAAAEASRLAYIAAHPVPLATAVEAWAAHKRKVAAILAASGARGVASK